MIDETTPLVPRKTAKEVLDESTLRAKRKLQLACLFALLFMVAEVIGGFMAGSLAIMTDAAHLLSDVAGFLISLFAIWIQTFPASSKMSYGFHRAEIIGAVISVLVIWVLTGFLVYAAIERLQDAMSDDPQEHVDGKLMFIIACIGLVVNLALMKILGHSHSHGGHGHSHGGGGHGHSHGSDSHGHSHGGHEDHDDHDHDVEAGHGHSHGGASDCHGKPQKNKKKKLENLNIEAAYIHALGDFLQSIGVCAAGALIWYEPKWQIADPIATFLFSVLVLWTTIGIVKSSIHVLMEGTPEGYDPDDILDGLLALSAVSNAHDLHIWSLSAGLPSLSVHLVSEGNPDEALHQAQEYLISMGIDHTTIQVEHASTVYPRNCGDPGACGQTSPRSTQSKIMTRRTPLSQTSLQVKRKLQWACIFALFFMVAEIIGGYIAGSLAIMTDAAHLLSDVAGFLISLFAIWIQTFPASSKMSYGFHRAEIIGAVISVLLIWVLTGFLVYAAVVRLQDALSDNPEEHVDGKLMFIIACLGLLVNLVLMKILGHSHSHGGHGHSHGTHDDDHENHDHDHDHDHNDDQDYQAVEDGHAQQENPKKKKFENLNIQSAYIHALGDFIQSIGVCIAGALIWWQPTWQIADPIATFLFSVLVLWTTVGIIKSSIHVLMEGTPAGYDPDAILEGLLALAAVSNAHDLHIWSLSAGLPSLSVHLITNGTPDEALHQAQEYLISKGIEHTTIQVEQASIVYPRNCDNPPACGQSSPQSENVRSSVNSHMHHAHPRFLHEQSESELYQTVVEARQVKLRSQLQKVAGQKAFIRHEKRRLLLQRALLESEVDRFNAALTSDWFCQDAMTRGATRLRIQVGEQNFEISHEIAKKDPKSLLAAMIAPDSPLQATDLGCFAVDRDWALFRHILNFLRDGILPNDPKLLKLLYMESDFWKLDTLKSAIEQTKIQLKKPPAVLSENNTAGKKANAEVTPPATKPW
ncbi:Cation Diffusion Facilitator (CDF) Family [Thraustotheca clavata]|uniref:Cation Diffusion Facilitator (CDF) Family n=1 Tax=Thraustotheca clavata TaxID=74557 RepID=A0A1W0A8V0_9STRA|nr:Cation Diffusion Facilitator (CDF) Family [Thraustotheca clavata]